MDAEMIGEIYNQYYSLSDNMDGDYKLNSIGWNSSFDGVPYSEEEMSEWRDNICGIIESYHPERIMEVACGTGMMMFSLIRHVKFYLGIDVAEEGIKYIKNHLSEEEKKKSKFLVMGAGDIGQIKEGEFDLAFINSATQYMGPEQVFADYVKKMADKVRYGGKIFLGDMKSRKYREMFYQTIEHWSDPNADVDEKVFMRGKHDFEFYINQEYLESLKESIPRIKKVEIFLKKGKKKTEMNLFRFEAVLHLDEYEEPDYQKYSCENLDCLGIEEVVKAHKEESYLELTGMKNQMLEEIMEDKLGEPKSDAVSVFISDVCDTVEKYGYQTKVIPCQDEMDAYFSVRAWKEETL